MRALRTALPGLLLAAALAGCGEDPSGTTEPSTPDAGGSGSSAPPTPREASPELTVSPSPGFGAPITVTGTVEEGVEAGCLVLRTEERTYLLLGGPRASLRPGESITVEGTTTDALLTTCQQGQPLQVVSVR